jgi:predicted aldo/keto reductase-like oxidoreductase
MKSLHLWNRRDFIAKPTVWLAASRLLGGFDILLGQSTKPEPAAPKAEGSAKPICRTLGKTGITLPIVSMGVMNADVPGLIRRSYELGIRHFDTAAHYQQGRNEEMVGSMIKEMGVRDKVIVSTKVLRPGWGFGPGAQTQQRIYSPAEVKAHFLEVFEGSLKRLQMDYVDMFYNHACDSEADIASEGALEALTDLKKEGKARFIGVSSHRPEMALNEVMKLGVYDVVLTTINYTMANDEGLLKTIDEAAKKGIGIVAMKTQAGGFRRPDARVENPLPPASQTAALKWVLRHEAITTAIPGYTRYDQIEQDFPVASNLAYTPEEREFLSNKNVAAEAQFCRQCGQCRSDCPRGVDIPTLMRSHMYAVQYSNHWLAAETVAGIAPGKGLAACESCESCRATCPNSVNIARKIQQLKEVSASGGLHV